MPRTLPSSPRRTIGVLPKKRPTTPPSVRRQFPLPVGVRKIILLHTLIPYYIGINPLYKSMMPGPDFPYGRLGPGLECKIAK